MNWIDLIIVLVVFAFAIKGEGSGFISQAIEIFVLLISIVVALATYLQTGTYLSKFANMPTILANPIAFLLIFAVASGLLALLANVFIRKYTIRFEQNSLNKALGVLPAVVNAAIFMAFALLFFVSLPFRPDAKKDIFSSKIGSILVDQAIEIEKPLNKVFGPLTKQSLTFITVSPRNNESIDLQFKQDQVTFDFESEQEMLALINDQRSRLGIDMLAWSNPLADVARVYGQDMFKLGYFSHYSPAGEDVGDRLVKAGINYAYAGENLALAPNTKTAFKGLMESEGHRKNMLNPSFRKVGIGVVNGGIYGRMFVQVFTQ